MDFDSLLCFDLLPAALEFFLHVAPDCSRLVVQLVNLDLGRFLELVQSVLTLDDGGLSHQEF